MQTSFLFITLFVGFFVSSLVHAERLLIVSDIDDTIKVSHVLSSAGKVSRATDITTPFRGMAELYQLVLEQNRQDRRIVYLSNAPESLAGVPAMLLAHKTFLSYNNFPYGEVELRESIFDKNHKINSIRSLIENEKPEILILVGDNGERDPEIYHQVFQEYGNRIRIITFIHQMYATKAPFYVPKFLAKLGTKILKEQIAFVTPVEIGLELSDRGLLDKRDYSSFIDQIVPEIVGEPSLKWDGLAPITFPQFKNCSEFKWRWKLSAELGSLIRKINSVCR